MPDSGQFFELSVPTEDILESLEFYLRLGFTEIPVNDIRDHYYAAVTDGRIAIGLHGDGFEEIALSFVWPDVARQVREFEEAGHEFTFVRLGDAFHEAELSSPDGHALRILEARTFSQRVYANSENPTIGQITEVSLRADDFRASSAFWQVAGLDADEDPGVDDTFMTMRAPGIVIGLRDDVRWHDPLLRFRSDDLKETAAALDRAEVTHKRHADGRVIVTPEGLRLLVVGGDYR
ncbi:MAG: VOC family protein [Gammaproteobacteria bacterium]